MERRDLTGPVTRRRFLATFGAALQLCILGLTACSDDVPAPDSDAQGRDPQEAAGGVGDTSIRVSFIDVGKGDCILVQAGDTAVLIDTGYANTSDAVLSYVRKQGVDRLAALIITHYDGDHIGGISAIGKKLPIDGVYLPGYVGGDKNYDNALAAIKNLAVPSQEVMHQMTLELGDTRLTLYPSELTYIPGTKGEEGNDNDLSLVLSLTCCNDSYLFLGDLEKEGIAAFLERNLGQFDVLKVPHHGKKNGMTDDLLESVRPKIAIVTDGSEKPASSKTLDLLEEAGADTYCTSTDGTIVVESDGTGRYEVSSA